LSSTAATAATTATTAAAGPPPPPPPPLWLNSPSYIDEERGISHQQQHHQHTSCRTIVKTFTSPDNLDLFNLSTVFEVYDVGQVNLEIIKLLA
jgi:hypothetical protein